MILYTCEKDFLDKHPLDQVGSEDFFRSPRDLETYVNQFYTSENFPISPAFGRDFDSDNSIDITADIRLQGALNLDDARSIDFSGVRSVNFFLDNYARVKENHDLEEYKQYLGEALFFKALIYFNLLDRYGDIQWLTNTLNTDSPELYKARDPRNVVTDSIIATLDKAATYLTDSKTNGASRINKWMALMLQSRVALFEGSWEEYHANTAFGVVNPQPEKYYSKVVEATTAIIESGLYDIYSTGNPTSDYYNLFKLRDYSSNQEVMFWQEFNTELGQGDLVFRREPNYRMQFPYENSLSKSLADSYLCIDGNPIANNNLFQGYTSIVTETQNRDPRFTQTIAIPDDVWKIYGDGSISYYNEVYDNLNTRVDLNCPGGYVIKKGYNPEVVYHVPQYEDTPGIIYRYAEVLLNYAEAKAQLGIITQADLDISINKLRERVGMPNLVLGSIVQDPQWDFPTLSPIINEVRRERRVELALEGLRFFDIRRWAAADELIVGERPKGFLASQLVRNIYPVDQNGFLDPYKNQIPNGYLFDVSRDYLLPISKAQIELNKDNLIQNPGWGE
ncbi:RagB/SusD family nutrient uptake outer membrane protein [Aestuariibaculum suncheonense]|nr:RagB/SusD family nutrient uptake outer membrane protein [Aestuariibaculum suncheonense]